MGVYVRLPPVPIVNRLGADYARADVQAVADGLAVFFEGRYRAGSETPVGSVFRGRYSAVSDLGKTFRGRYSLTEEVSKTFRGRYGQTVGQVIFRGRYGVVKNLVKTFVGRYACEGPELGAEDPFPVSPSSPIYPGFGRSAQRLAWQCGIGDLEVTIQADGKVLDANEVEILLILNESNSHHWEISFPDPKGYYHPRFSARHGNGWEGKMTGSSSKVFECWISWGGREIYFRGVARGAGHDRSVSGGKRNLNFKWKGQCESFKMFDEGIDQETLRSSRAGVVSQRVPLVEALAAKDIPINRLPATLRPLRLMHRQNRTVAEIVQRICNRNGLGWCFRDGGIWFYPLTKGQPKYVYDGAAAIEAEGWDSDNTDLVSFVRIKRVAESGEMATNPITCTDFGDSNSVTFPEPLYGVTWRPLQETLGFFSNLIFRDEQGNVLAVHEPYGTVWAQQLIGKIPNGVKSVSWTFGAQVGVVGLTAGFGQIVFTGRPGDKGDSEFPEQFDTTFAVVRQNATLVDLIGTNLRELPADEVVGTEDDARAYGDFYLAKLLLYFDPKQLTVPLNLGLFPGETVGERDPFLENELRTGFLRQVRHRIVKDPGGRSTTYVASGWEAP